MCHNYITDSLAQTVNCTLCQNLFACPGDVLYFTCVTKDSSSLEWSSEVYIGEGGARLNITSDTQHHVHNHNNSRAVARLLNSSIVNGTPMLTSTLTITVLWSSVESSPHSVTCHNVDVGTHSSVYFEMAGI